MPDTTKYDASEKLRYEIEKLQAETEHLRRPWLRTPASWVTILIALATLTGSTAQYFSSNRRADLAEIKRETTELEILKLEEVRKQAEASLKQVEAKRIAAGHELEEVQGHLNSLKTQVPSTPQTR